jgi:hypothetical protein
MRKNFTRFVSVLVSCALLITTGDFAHAAALSQQPLMAGRQIAGYSTFAAQAVNPAEAWVMDPLSDVRAERLAGSNVLRGKDPKAIPVDELEISVRAYNDLKAAGFETLGDITALTEEQFMKLKKFLMRSKLEVKNILDHLGLNFKAAEPATPPATNPRGPGSRGFVLAGLLASLASIGVVGLANPHLMASLADGISIHSMIVWLQHYGLLALSAVILLFVVGSLLNRFYPLSSFQSTVKILSDGLRTGEITLNTEPALRTPEPPTMVGRDDTPQVQALEPISHPESRDLEPLSGWDMWKVRRNAYPHAVQLLPNGYVVVGLRSNGSYGAAMYSPHGPAIPLKDENGIPISFTDMKGMTVDENGAIYVLTPQGLLTYSMGGQLEAIHSFPELDLHSIVHDFVVHKDKVYYTRYGIHPELCINELLTGQQRKFPISTLSSGVPGPLYLGIDRPNESIYIVESDRLEAFDLRSESFRPSPIPAGLGYTQGVAFDDDGLAYFAGASGFDNLIIVVSPREGYLGYYEFPLIHTTSFSVQGEYVLMGRPGGYDVMPKAEILRNLVRKPLPSKGQLPIPESERTLGPESSQSESPAAGETHEKPGDPGSQTLSQKRASFLAWHLNRMALVISGQMPNWLPNWRINYLNDLIMEEISESGQGAPTAPPLQEDVGLDAFDLKYLISGSRAGHNVIPARNFLNEIHNAATILHRMATSYKAPDGEIASDHILIEDLPGTGNQRANLAILTRAKQIIDQTSAAAQRPPDDNATVNAPWNLIGVATLTGAGFIAAGFGFTLTGTFLIYAGAAWGLGWIIWRVFIKLALDRRRLSQIVSAIQSGYYWAKIVTVVSVGISAGVIGVTNLWAWTVSGVVWIPVGSFIVSAIAFSYAIWSIYKRVHVLRVWNLGRGFSHRQREIGKRRKFDSEELAAA